MRFFYSRSFMSAGIRSPFVRAHLRQNSSKRKQTQTKKHVRCKKRVSCGWIRPKLERNLILPQGVDENAFQCGNLVLPTISKNEFTDCGEIEFRAPVVANLPRWRLLEYYFFILLVVRLLLLCA